MKKLQFTIEISAPKEKVWEALWNDANYRKWAAVFHEDSYYESDLQEGSDILFLGPGRSGMFGVIEKMVPYEKMYFLHKGEVKEGVKLGETFGTDGIERYDLEEKDGKTELAVTLNSPEEYIAYFAGTFPKALETLKKLAEDN